MLEQAETKQLLMEFFWRARGYVGYQHLTVYTDEQVVEEISFRLDYGKQMKA